jgi:hypothetical protein
VKECAGDAAAPSTGIAERAAFAIAKVREGLIVPG